MLSSGTQLQAVVDTDDASVQATVSYHTRWLRALQQQLHDDVDMKRPPFCIEAIKNDDKAVTSFYTGFMSYLLVLIFLNQQPPLYTTM